MKKFQNIRVYEVFKSFIHMFLMSCGLVLLFHFYNYTEPFTQESIFNEIKSLIIVLISLRILTELFKTSSVWFHDEKTTVSEKPLSLLSDESGVEIPMKADVKFAEYQKKVSAIHEAGHAVMAYLLGVEVFKVSLSHLNSHVITVLKNGTYEDVRKSILNSYAGAIAEEILIGYFSTGSIYGDNSDFHKATEQIKAYIVMSNSGVSKTLLDEELSDEIILISKRFYQEGMDILMNNKQLLKTVSDSLLKKDYMSKEDFIKCVENLKVFH